ncbi:MAG: hypothetical protein KGH57_04015 [Candidatus Micrarchaeota archaeon]|nr:hypothetical protein [Candidatus Micrarchaeota archaeon]
MRLQSAMEFLITYGWAFTIIAIVLLALFVSGYFSPSNYAGQECTLTSGFSCLSFFLYSNGILSVNLQQSLSVPINVTMIGCNQNGSIARMQKPFNPPSNQIFMSIGGNYTFSVACYTGTGPLAGNTVSVFNGALIINYTNDETQLPGTAIGRVVAKPI